MSKPLLGLILGGILGAFDGLSALISAPNEPAVREGIVGIVIGSTVKGLIVGVVTGLVARKFNSMGIGIACGFTIGTAGNGLTCQRGAARLTTGPRISVPGLLASGVNQ